MQRIEGFDFFQLKFDANAKLTSDREFEALLARVEDARATDAIFIAHGFRNDETDASTLYGTFLKTFRAHLSRPEFEAVAKRRFVVAGVYWPSKPFRETYGENAPGTRGLQNPAEAMADVEGQLEELKQGESTAHRATLEKAEALLPTLAGNAKKQDEFVKLVLSIVDGSTLDTTEGLPQVRKQKGSELLARLSDAPAERSRGIGGLFGGIAGGVGAFLNLTKWYVMKDRSGTVGAKGVAAVVRQLHDKYPAVKIHLVGHSLGGRLMAS